MDERIELTLDQFFKAECGEFFSLAQYEVQTEFELIAGVKRIDAVLRRKKKQEKKAWRKVEKKVRDKRP